MSRPRKPTIVLERNGAFERNPKRKKEREDEPQITEPLGDPPEILDEAEQARWKDIAEVAVWLNKSHRGIVEQTCRMWMRERKGTASSADSKLLQTNFRVLGMTPSDSSKVKMPKHDQDDRSALLA